MIICLSGSQPSSPFCQWNLSTEFLLGSLIRKTDKGVPALFKVSVGAGDGGGGSRGSLFSSHPMTLKPFHGASRISGAIWSKYMLSYVMICSGLLNDGISVYRWENGDTDQFIFPLPYSYWVTGSRTWSQAFSWLQCSSRYFIRSVTTESILSLIPGGPRQNLCKAGMFLNDFLLQQTQMMVATWVTPPWLAYPDSWLQRAEGVCNL